MRILLLDIENTPNLAHVWSLWNVNVGLSQLIEATEIMSFSAKWLGESKVEFYSTFHHGKDKMLERAHALLNEADVVVHYNGKHHDMPHLNREFVQAGYKPPAPYKQIDLLEVIKKVFRFPSNKLAYVSKALGLEGKVEHEGHTLWIKCMAGDAKAWARMRKYNKQDVVLLEGLYWILQPWIPSIPSYGPMEGRDVCPACGSDDLRREGFAYTQVGRFQRYVCGACGKWSRATKRDQSTQITGVAS